MTHEPCARIFGTAVKAASSKPGCGRCLICGAASVEAAKRSNTMPVAAPRSAPACLITGSGPSNPGYTGSPQC